MSEEKKPNRPNHNGQDEMEELLTLAKKKKMHVGVLIKPKRKVDELKDERDPANIVVAVSNTLPIEDNVVISDEVTESLAVSAKFLLEELKHQ